MMMISKSETVSDLNIDARSLYALDFAALNREINAGLADPKLKAHLVELGGAQMLMTSAELGKLIADDVAKWAKVI